MVIMMSPQRYRRLVLILSVLLIPSSQSVLLPRGKVRRTQDLSGVGPDDIKQNFQPDNTFSVTEAAAALLQNDEGITATGGETVDETTEATASQGEDHAPAGLSREK